MSPGRKRPARRAVADVGVRVVAEHQHHTPGVTCVGNSLAMWTATALCVVDRNYPALITPGA